MTLQKRKSALKPYLDQKYHYLLWPTNPVTKLLLGPDLEQKIQDSTKMFGVSRKLTVLDPKNSKQEFRQWSWTPNSFRGWGSRAQQRGLFSQNTNRYQSDRKQSKPRFDQQNYNKHQGGGQSGPQDYNKRCRN